MQRSTERILTTHTGSLIRTPEIIEGIKAKIVGKGYDAAKLAADTQQGIQEVVRKQIQIGIDIPNDGELGRRGFTAYIHERLGGLAPRAADERELQASFDEERAEFPDFFAQYNKHSRYLWMYPQISMDEVQNIRGQDERFRVTRPISYIGHAAVQQDIGTLKSALQESRCADAFLTSVTPTTRKTDSNFLDFYRSEADYLYAIAEALHEEYRAITSAGLILQLDRAALTPTDKPNLTEREKLKTWGMGVEIVNHALRQIPEEQVRFHYCWGSNNRPHTTDIPLRVSVHEMLKIKAQAFGVEGANPRHEHEWQVWKDVKLPDGKILFPGLISQSTNVVEHPELVALRIKNFASVVGKENIIALTDCGFSQQWDSIRVHPTVQWAKLQALVDGAALASAELWG